MGIGRVVRLVGVVGISVGAMVVPVGGAAASVGASASLSLPSGDIVGVAMPGSITVVNTNTPPNNTETNTVTTLQLAPSCATAGTVSSICSSPDPGVFSFAATGTGAAGTACGGQTFSISAPDSTGTVTFTRQGGPLTVPPPDGVAGHNQCTVNFTVTARKVPGFDADAATPNTQTRANMVATMQSAPSGLVVTSRPSLVLTILAAPHADGDFDGDSKTDLAVFRPSTGAWYTRPSGGGGDTGVVFGGPGDLPVAGDYDGDGKVDRAVYRPSTGMWLATLSAGGSMTVHWGIGGDVPVPADYVGDARTDIAVFRPSNGTWYVQGLPAVQFGANGDIPVPADYVGDAKADIAVFRPANGTWYVRGGATTPFGVNGDIPVPANYFGDAKADIAVYRPSTGAWYVQGGGAVFGANGDIPVPGDYVGDARADLAVFRPSTGTWFVRGGATTRFGTSGDVPIPLPSAVRSVFFS